MRTLCLVAAMSLVLSAATVHAQSLELGFGGGPAFVEKVDGRSYTSDIDKAGLGFGLSYSINGLARLSFDNSPFSWSGRIGYLHSSGSGTLPIAGLYIQGPGSVETRVDVWTLSVGPQWAILRGPVTPYVGADIQLSSFGKFHYKLTNALGTNDYLSGGGVRVGLGLNVGAQIALNPAMSLDLRAGYNLMSPLSTYGPSDFRTLGLSATMMFRVP